jgi:hypothetical protein
MTPYKQLISHDPADGVLGDCHRTCIASLLDLHPSQVPHIGEKYPTLSEWLASRHLREVVIPIKAPSLKGALFEFSMMHVGLNFILTGNSPRGEHHSVIACDGQIVHDPSAEGGGLIGPCDDGYWWVSVLARAT